MGRFDYLPQGSLFCVLRSPTWDISVTFKVRLFSATFNAVFSPTLVNCISSQALYTGGASALAIMIITIVMHVLENFQQAIAAKRF
jgi:hypothetical protein